ncbi:hypothetical protein WJX74_005605 [Apatococcus lobatus]|uniref:Chromo domain-containing protein n=1 Tax=Apatococcus lobatus TaxID=904363 RepID=A0AAW1Q236_9CHLO
MIPKPWSEIYPGRAVAKKPGSKTRAGYCFRYERARAGKGFYRRRYIVIWDNGEKEEFERADLTPLLLDYFLDEVWVLPNIRALQKVGWDMSKLPAEEPPASKGRKRKQVPSAAGKAQAGAKVSAKHQKTVPPESQAGKPSRASQGKGERGGKPPLAPKTAAKRGQASVYAPTDPAKSTGTPAAPVSKPGEDAPEATAPTAAAPSNAAASPDELKVTARKKQAAGPAKPVETHGEDMVKVNGTNFSIPKRLTFTEGDTPYKEYVGQVFEEEMEVEHLCWERRTRGKVEFLVKYKGYELDHNDWLPRRALRHNVALDAWERAQKAVAEGSTEHLKGKYQKEA